MPIYIVQVHEDSESYEIDPLTQTKTEGIAWLCEKLSEDAETETWLVRFCGENAKCTRRIKSTN